MKTIFLCIISAIFFISCSADSDFEIAEKTSANKEAKTVEKSYPANPVNPFDLKGKMIYEALDIYYQEKQFPISVSELADQISFVSSKLDDMKGNTSTLITFTEEMVQSIMDDPDNKMILIVQNSALQQYAKTNLIAFLQELITKREQEFSITYDYITRYESEVISDFVFTTEETETLLTVASISRYSFYFERGRKDRDWNIIVGDCVTKPFFEVNEMSLISIIALLDRLI